MCVCVLKNKKKYVRLLLSLRAVYPSSFSPFKHKCVSISILLDIHSERYKYVHTRTHTHLSYFYLSCLFYQHCDVTTHFFDAGNFSIINLFFLWREKEKGEK